MIELIEKLKAAPVGNRELDSLVTIATTPPYLLANDIEGNVGINRYGTVMSPVWEKFEPEHAGHYTTSMTHAMLLVPRGWRIYRISDERHFQINRGWCAGIDKIAGGKWYHHYAATPSLALCIVVLLAYENIRETNSKETQR